MRGGEVVNFFFFCSYDQSLTRLVQKFAGGKNMAQSVFGYFKTKRELRQPAPTLGGGGGGLKSRAVDEITFISASLIPTIFLLCIFIL